MHTPPRSAQTQQQQQGSQEASSKDRFPPVLRWGRVCAENNSLSKMPLQTANGDGVSGGVC